MSLQSQMKTLLDAAFSPAYLELINDSHQHNVPANSETHFTVVIVSETLGQLSKVKRHQAVYQSLNSLFEQGLHALSIRAFSQAEWEQSPDFRKNPSCLGGSK